MYRLALCLTLILLNISCSKPDFPSEDEASAILNSWLEPKNHYFQKSLTYTADSGQSFYYSLSIPNDYESREGIPVIVYLHGNGGDENSELEVFSSYVQKTLEQCSAKQPIIVFPGDSNRLFLLDENYHIATGIIESVGRSYSLAPPSRRLITGFSTGGAYATRTLIVNPGSFASSVSWAGGLWPKDKVLFESAKMNSNKLIDDNYKAHFYIGGKDSPKLYKPLWKIMADKKLPFEKVVLKGQKHNLAQYFIRSQELFTDVVCGL